MGNRNMRRNRVWRTTIDLFLIGAMTIGLSAYAQKKSKKKEVETATIEEAKEHFSALPDSAIDVKKNRNLISLGKKLYLETALSINGKISCNSCHKLDKFGVDNEATSPGHDGRRGDRNSPTSFNAALHLAQFWDGRAKDVEEQALGPILNPIEMGMKSEKDVVDKLAKMKEYVGEFKKAFPKEKEPLTYKNIGVAIGAFERTLITPSRFDKFLKGDKNALSTQEKRGLKKFIETGCIACHNGPLLGGNSYQTLGLVNEYKTEDLGRFNVTKDEDDKKMFKVPSLRNVLKTHPYFHDGSIKTVDEAIKLMAFHQLDQKVDKTFIADIKAFFGSLTTDKKFN